MKLCTKFERDRFVRHMISTKRKIMFLPLNTASYNVWPCQSGFSLPITIRQIVTKTFIWRWKEQSKSPNIESWILFFLCTNWKSSWYGFLVEYLNWAIFFVTKIKVFTSLCCAGLWNQVSNVIKKYLLKNDLNIYKMFHDVNLTLFVPFGDNLFLMISQTTKFG